MSKLPEEIYNNILHNILKERSQMKEKKTRVIIDYLHSFTEENKKLPAITSICSVVGVSQNSVKACIDIYNKHLHNLSPRDEADKIIKEASSERAKSIKRIESISSIALDSIEKRIGTGDFSAKDLEVIEKLAQGLHKRDLDETETEILDIDRIEMKITGTEACEKELELLKKKRRKV